MTAFMDIFADLFNLRDRIEAECQPLVASVLPVDVVKSISRFLSNAPLDIRSQQGCTPSIQFGLASDIGARYDNQDVALAISTTDDAAETHLSAGVFMVADGIGGRDRGAEASRTATEVISAAVIEEIIVPLLEEDLEPFDEEAVWDTLHSAMNEAHETVQREFPGSGSTATVAVIQDRLAYIAHIGDSRAYLITDGSIKRLTRDHSFAFRLYEMGSITADEININAYRNMLYRAIGTKEDFGTEVGLWGLPPDSRLLLCSDGLWNRVPVTMMLKIVDESRDLQAACEQLVELALKQGTQDNITALLVAA